MTELSLAELRQRLGILDDPEVDALCLDHFATVYAKFSRGMRRDEKINVLLNHCRDRPAERARLISILAKDTVASATEQSAVTLDVEAADSDFPSAPQRALTPPPSEEDFPRPAVKGKRGGKLLRLLRDPVWQAIGAIVAVLALVVAVGAGGWPDISSLFSSAAPSSPVPAPVPGIKITSPQNSVECAWTGPCTFEVQGIYTGLATLEDWQIVIFVNPEPVSAGRWFPHPETSIWGDNTWKGPARIGGEDCNPAGDDLQLVAMVLTNEQIQKVDADNHQPLPAEFVAQSGVISLLTSYPTIPIDLARASGSSAQGSQVVVTATESSVEIEYDLGTGGWVQAAIPLSFSDMFCMKEQQAVVAFSLDITGAANTFEVKLEDADGSNYYYASQLRTSQPAPQAFAIPLTNFEHLLGGNPPEMDWWHVRKLLFAVSEKPGDEGGAGKLIVRDVVVTIAPGE